MNVGLAIRLARAAFINYGDKRQCSLKYYAALDGLILKGGTG